MAVKVVRSISKYRSAAMIEIDVLNLLAKHDKDGSRYVSGLRVAYKWYKIQVSYHFFICDLQLCTDSKMV